MARTSCKRHRYVEAPQDVRQLLQMKYRVSMSTVCRALNFRCTGPVAREIRVYAVNQLGCKIFEDAKHLL